MADALVDVYLIVNCGIEGGAVSVIALVIIASARHRQSTYRTGAVTVIRIRQTVISGELPGTLGALKIWLELVSSAGRLFTVFTGSVNRDKTAKDDLDKDRVVLPVRGVAALT